MTKTKFSYIIPAFVFSLLAQAYIPAAAASEEVGDTSSSSSSLHRSSPRETQPTSRVPFKAEYVLEVAEMFTKDKDVVNNFRAVTRYLNIDEGSRRLKATVKNLIERDIPSDVLEGMLSVGASALDKAAGLAIYVYENRDRPSEEATFANYPLLPRREGISSSKSHY